MNHIFLPTRFRSSLRRWFSPPVASRSAPCARAGIGPVRHEFQSAPAFPRQGEWLFVPAPEVRTPLVIHWCAPLVHAGGGTPHIVAELARGQGEVAWHHPQHAPDEITNHQFQLLPEPVRRTPGWTERLRVTDSVSLFARGAVRHPDHAPILLDHWHRVTLPSEHHVPGPASPGYPARDA
jgi:hypothetical protein